MHRSCAEEHCQSAQMMNGAQAMALGFALAGVRIAYTYPITPQIEVMEALSRFEEIAYVQADSEYSVLAGAEGVAWTGERCAIATASQGLVLMSEVMWEVAGNRLPLVMGVFNRGLKGPGWCLGAQQNDALFMRDTGWLQFFCESAQEVLDFILIAFRVAEEVCLPAMVAGDGFYLSHETEEVWIPDRREALEFVGERVRSGNPMAAGGANYVGLMAPLKYFRAYQRMYHDMARVPHVFEKVAQEFAHRFGRRYHLLSPIYHEDAETVLIAAGTMCGTVRDVVERRRSRGQKIGMVKVHGLRPFPRDALLKVIGSAPRLATFDRNLALGLGGIFASEVRLALQGHEGRSPQLFSFVTGLGGTDVTPEMVEHALDYMSERDKPPSETLFLYETGVEE